MNKTMAAFHKEETVKRHTKKGVIVPKKQTEMVEHVVQGQMEMENVLNRMTDGDGITCLIRTYRDGITCC
jgi:hypothetical protein